MADREQDKYTCEVRQSNGKLHIGYVGYAGNGAQILTEIEPALSLNYSIDAALVFQDESSDTGTDKYGSYTEYRFDYSNEDVYADLTLRFRCYEYGMLGFADVRLRIPDSVFSPKHYFLSPERGVRLLMRAAGNVTGSMANAMHNPWWCKPFFADRLEAAPDHTGSLLWSDGRVYHQLLAVCHETFKTEMQGTNDGLMLYASSHSGNVREGSVLMFAFGSSRKPFELAEATFAAAMNSLHTTGRNRQSRKYPEPLEYLGWCSWDAFYYEVSEQGLLDKMEECKQKELPVRWVMIDAGWSPERDRMLTSFEANESAFPGGLSRAVAALKNGYGVHWVGVWHAFTGYWSGVDPKSELASEWSKHLLTTSGGAVIPHPDPSRGFGFWNGWYTILKKAGVDFVKVDSQSSLIQFVDSEIPITRAARGFHEAVEAAAGLHFDGMMINCMGMAPENIWQRPGSAVSRSSNDFMPKGEVSFGQHAVHNVYNSYYTGNIYWSDWDMWWSVHTDNARHALLRAISGGPVYISDAIGKTDPDLIWPLILHDGRVLKCDQPGLPTEDCLLSDPLAKRIPLKIWNTCRSGQSGAIAMFNLHSDEAVAGTVSPADIPSIIALSETFVVYDYFRRTAVRVSSQERIQAELAADDYSLHLVIPVVNGFAWFGLIDKYMAPATLDSVYYTGTTVYVIVKEGGTFGFAADRKPDRVTVNGHAAEVASCDGYYSVVCDSGNERSVIVICQSSKGGET